MAGLSPFYCNDKCILSLNSTTTFKENSKNDVVNVVHMLAHDVLLHDVMLLRDIAKRRC